MQEEENDFLCNVTNEERSLFRKRVVGMILATDMGSHQVHMDEIKNRVQALGISKEANNGHLYVQNSDEVSNFQAK